MLFENVFARWLPKRTPEASTPDAGAPPPSFTEHHGFKQVSAPDRAQQDNPRDVLEDRCHKIGKNTAIESGSPKANAALLQTLEARAGSIAQAAHVPPSEERDRRRVTRLAVLGEDHDRQVIDRDRHAVYHAEALKHLAELGPREQAPAFPMKFYYAALIGLSISMAPTFHDLFVGLDPFLKWAAGGVCALGVSLLIVHGILPGSPNETPSQSRGDKY